MRDTYRSGYVKAIIDFERAFSTYTENGIRINKKFVQSFFKALIADADARDAWIESGGELVTLVISPKGEIVEIRRRE